MAHRRHRADFTLDQLRIFVVVAEKEHMTLASHELDIAQSAVSATMAALEATLSVKLFERIGRNIRLTQAGLLLRTEAVGLLKQVEELRRKICPTL